MAADSALDMGCAADSCRHTGTDAAAALPRAIGVALLSDDTAAETRARCWAADFQLEPRFRPPMGFHGVRRGQAELHHTRQKESHCKASTKRHGTNGGHNLILWAQSKILMSHPWCVAGGMLHHAALLDQGGGRQPARAARHSHPRPASSVSTILFACSSVLGRVGHSNESVKLAQSACNV